MLKIISIFILVLCIYAIIRKVLPFLFVIFSILMCYIILKRVINKMRADAFIKEQEITNYQDVVINDELIENPVSLGLADKDSFEKKMTDEEVLRYAYMCEMEARRKPSVWEEELSSNNELNNE